MYDYVYGAFVCFAVCFVVLGWLEFGRCVLDMAMAVGGIWPIKNENQFVSQSSSKFDAMVVWLSRPSGLRNKTCHRVIRLGAYGISLSLVSALLEIDISVSIFGPLLSFLYCDR